MKINKAILEGTGELIISFSDNRFYVDGIYYERPADIRGRVLPMVTIRDSECDGNCRRCLIERKRYEG